jgi:hygromycin-B 7''-O-kinase
MLPPEFATVQDYARCFTAVDFWQPYIESICRRHGVAIRAIRAGLAGTNPVFLVDDGGQGCVVKLFETKFFGGADSYQYERAIYSLTGAAPAIPAPALIAEGDLFGDGVWPYLIITVIPGVSLGEAAGQVDDVDWAAVAQFVGQVLRRLHERAVTNIAVLERTRSQFRGFIARQRANCGEQHRQWQTLPSRLIVQLDSYLLPLDALVDGEPALRLLHGDLNWDHVLGEFVDNHWVPRGVIDFGDARVGDLLYEMVVVHLGLFRCNKALLRLFLQAYGDDGKMRQNFVARAMNYTLLHQYNVLGEAPAGLVKRAATFDELALALWEI